VDAEAVMHLFLDPPYSPPGEMKWNPLDGARVRKILVDGHDFSEDRIGRMIEGVERMTKERSAQSKLDKWF